MHSEKSSHFQQQHLEPMSADSVKLCKRVLALQRVALMRAAHTALASRGGQPDHSIGQMPYDLLEYMSAPPSVTHASDQTLLAFDSIAATFGFRHHVGTDPSLEIKVIKHILRREMLVAKIKEMVNKLRSGSDQRHRGDHRSGLLDCLTLLRDSSADTVESVVLWREGLPTYPPPAFIWEGRNYLLKMNRDLDFLADVDTVADMLGIPKDKLKSNPLVLSDTSMPLEPGMDMNDMLEGADAEKARMVTLTQVLLLERKFEAERRQHKAETLESADGAGFLGDASSPERDTDDTNLWRKKINVFNWFDEAQHQLESLKKSMEVGQKLLKAMESTQPMDDFGRLPQDRLQPLAASVPNPMAMPAVLLSPNIATLLDGAHADRLRHPLETDDLGATFPVPFSHQLGNMLISQVNFKRKKPPPRPCQPKYLENIPSRYLEAPKPPVTTEESDDAYQRRVAKMDARGRRPTITQPRGPVFGKPKSSRGRGRRTKSADAAIPRHQPQHEEQQQQQQHGNTGEEYCVTSMHDPLGREVEEPPKTAIAARRQQKRTRRRAERLRAVARKRKGSEGRYTPQEIVAALTEDDLLQLGLLREPSKALAAAGAAALILLAPGDEIPTNVTWPIFQARISSRNQFLSELANFDCDTVPKFKIRALKNFTTSGSDVLPTSLLDVRSAGAKVSAWVFQVLLLQSDFTGENAPLAAIADAIDQVMRPYEKAEADMSSCTSVGISSVSKADQLSVVTTATKRASILYQHEHVIHGQAVFVTIIGGSDGRGTQVKVYDPITSHEICVEFLQDELSPTPPFQAWVERHLPGLLVLDEDEKLHGAPR